MDHAIFFLVKLSNEKIRNISVIGTYRPTIGFALLESLHWNQEHENKMTDLEMNKNKSEKKVVYLNFINLFIKINTLF